MNASNADDKAILIRSGQAVMGCELGSTRIKASLVSLTGQPLASGSYGWENRYEDGVWTYHMEDVWQGVAGCYSDLAHDVRQRYGVEIESLAAAGFSGMMHGYLALDEHDRLLAPFRTWRNNITAPASEELTALFDWPIPQRWTIAHLYQAILEGEGHVSNVAHITTLAAYVHWKLTGERSIGVGEASGMFPVDPDTGDWNAKMLRAFDDLIAERGFPWNLKQILPLIVPVGETTGTLSAEGAALLDRSGRLKAGIPLCPPEGDAGTGMVVTNAIKPRTGNVSAGTSVFAMLVLEEKLSRARPEIDLVVTPNGHLVGMAHSNNCTSDFNAWVGLIGEALAAFGHQIEDDELFGVLMAQAMEGAPDAGGLLSYGYVSGEHLTGFSEGRPLFVRHAENDFTLANFMRVHLYSALAALRTGLDVLTGQEGVQVDELVGHGGFFKTTDVGQRIMAAATNTVVRVPVTASEGGSWGMALLAAFAAREDRATTLDAFLDQAIGNRVGMAIKPDPVDVEGFNRFFQRYTSGLPVERAAVEHIGPR